MKSEFRPVPFVPERDLDELGRRNYGCEYNKERVGGTRISVIVFLGSNLFLQRSDLISGNKPCLHWHHSHS
jgi:hypothetical protein